jgi:hypothetical protein
VRGSWLALNEVLARAGPAGERVPWIIPCDGDGDGVGVAICVVGLA